jgi:hypothetical protein
VCNTASRAPIPNLINFFSSRRERQMLAQDGARGCSRSLAFGNRGSRAQSRERPQKRPQPLRGVSSPITLAARPYVAPDSSPAVVRVSGPHPPNRIASPTKINWCPRSGAPTDRSTSVGWRYLAFGDLENHEPRDPLSRPSTDPGATGPSPFGDRGSHSRKLTRLS